jgi:phage I-like protein
MRRILRKFFGSRRRLYVNSDRKLPKGFYLHSIPVDAAGENGFLKIVPVGYFPNHPDGAHEVKAEDIQRMFDNSAASSKIVLVDFEHRSLWGDTRAAGWSSNLEVRPDGLYWKYPDFTPPTAEMIKNKEYRFFSPAYQLNAKDLAGRSIGARLDHVALTNRPLFETEIDHICNSNTEESEMFTKEELPALRVKYGLPETADEAAIKAAILKGQPAPAAEKKDDVKDDDPVANSATGKALLAGIKSLTETVAGLVANSKQSADAALEAMVDRAIVEKRILPRDKAVYLNSAKLDADGTRKVLDAIKPNAVLGGMIDPAKAGDPEKPVTTTVANAQKSAAEFFKSSGRAPLAVKAA